MTRLPTTMDVQYNWILKVVATLTIPILLDVMLICLSTRSGHGFQQGKGASFTLLFRTEGFWLHDAMPSYPDSGLRLQLRQIRSRNLMIVSLSTIPVA